MELPKRLQKTRKFHETKAHTEQNASTGENRRQTESSMKNQNTETQGRATDHSKLLGIEDEEKHNWKAPPASSRRRGFSPQKLD